MVLKWIPNVLTLLRIGLTPFIIWFVYYALKPDENYIREINASIAFVLFSVAAVTDWFDGYLARRFDAASELGAKLDLWADKILVFGVLLGAFMFQPIVALTGMLALTVRDIFIMRLRARRPDLNLKATFLAKSKTALIMAAMAIAMFGTAFRMRALRLEDVAGADLMQLVIRLALALFIFGCVLSLGTGYEYFRAAWQGDRETR